jgi:hypothetical protein
MLRQTLQKEKDKVVLKKCKYCEKVFDCRAAGCGILYHEKGQQMIKWLCTDCAHENKLYY